MSVNKVILLGRVGKDPISNQSQNGNIYCFFSLATSEKWKDKSGQQQEHTEWHNLKAFGKTAELISRYVKKGSLVFVEGQLKTEKTQDKNGQEIYRTSIVVATVQFLDKKEVTGDEPATQYAPNSNFNYSPGIKDNFTADDIPF